MKKKIGIVVLLIAVLGLWLSIASAGTPVGWITDSQGNEYQCWQEDDWLYYYESDDGNPILLQFNDASATTVTLPVAFDGKPVTKILPQATRNIVHAIIPGGMSVLPEGSFSRSANLKTVTFESGVTEIGENAFYQCYALEEVTFPETLTHVGYQAFTECTSLMEVAISATSSCTIDTNAFYGCTGLTNLTLHQANVGYQAFIGCTSLEEVTISSTQSCTIGENGFYGCTGLTDLTINPNVTVIDKAAFYGCTGLNTVSLPNTLTSIGSGAFTHLEGAIPELKIPASVTSLELPIVDNECIMVVEDPSPALALLLAKGNYANFRIEGESDTPEVTEGVTVAQRVDAIVAAVIREGMTDYQKALALHDYLTQHAQYNVGHENESTDPWHATNHEADGVLLHGTGVCESYTKAYRLLLNKVGIENDVQTSETHTWNLVKLDGEWYHVDVTWDDPTTDSQGTSLEASPRSGREGHHYFCIPDYALEGVSEHEFNESGKPSAAGYALNYDYQHGGLNSRLADLQSGIEARLQDGETEFSLTFADLPAFNPDTANGILDRTALTVMQHTEYAGLNDTSYTVDAFTYDGTTLFLTMKAVSKGPSPQPETDLPEALCSGHDATLILLPVEGAEALRTWQLFAAAPETEDDQWDEIDSGSSSLLTREEILLSGFQLYAEKKIRLVITVLQDGHDATVVEKEWTVMDHDYHGTVVKEATCEERGEILMTCSRCGDTWTRYIDALYHEWDEGTVTVAPTSTTEGEILYHCIRCDATKTEAIPVIPEIQLRISGTQTGYARPEVKAEFTGFSTDVWDYQWCYLTQVTDPAAIPGIQWNYSSGFSAYPMPSDPDGAETGWFYARAQNENKWVYGKLPLSFVPLSSLPEDPSLEVKLLTMSETETFGPASTINVELHGPANSTVLLSCDRVDAIELGSMGTKIKPYYSGNTEGTFPVALVVNRDGKQYRSAIQQIIIAESDNAAPAAEYRVLSGSEIPVNGTFDIEIAPSENIGYVNVALRNEATSELVGWSAGVPESANFTAQGIPPVSSDPLVLHVPLNAGAPGDRIAAEITTGSTINEYKTTTVKDREDLRFTLTAAEGMSPISFLHMGFTYLREKAVVRYMTQIVVKCRGAENVDVEWISAPESGFFWNKQTDENAPGEYYVNIMPEQIGTYTLRATATDAAGNTQSAEYALEVVNPIQATITADLPDKLIAFEGGTLHFDVSDGPDWLYVSITFGDNQLVYQGAGIRDIQIPANLLKDVSSVSVEAFLSYTGFESNTIREEIPVVQPDNRVALQQSGADEGPDGLTAPAGRWITFNADAPEADWVRLHFWNTNQTQIFTKDDPHEWMWSMKVPDENAAQVCYLEAGFGDDVCYSEPVSIASVWYGNYTDPISYTLTGIRNGKLYQQRNLGISLPANGIPTNYILQICKADNPDDSVFWDAFDITDEAWTGEFLTPNLTAGTEYRLRITRQVEGYTEDSVLSEPFLVTEFDDPSLTASAASIKVRETVDLTAEDPAGQAVSICRMEGDIIAEQIDGGAGAPLVWSFSPETAGTYVFRLALRDTSTDEITLTGDPVTVEVTSDGPSPQPETDLPEALCAGHDTTLILLPVEGTEALRTWQLSTANPGTEDDLWIETDSGSGSLLTREEISLPGWYLFADEKVRLIVTVLQDGHDATVVEKTWTVTDHVWDEGVVTVPASCTEDGEILYTCIHCGQTMTDWIDRLNHDYQGTVVKEPTCEERGEILMTCSRCGDTWTRYIDALYHEWNDGTVTVPATCTEDGEILYHCIRCDSTKTEVVPATGHSWSEEITDAATCQHPGEVYRICETCNERETVRVLEQLDHTWGEDITDAATCQHPGEVYHVCEACNERETVRVLEQLDHTWGEEITDAATCQHPGEVYHVCEACNERETVRVLEQLDHTWGEDITDAATCQHPGEVYHVCEACNERETVRVLEQLSHIWDGGILVHAPTSQTEGLIRYTCQVGGESREESMPKLEKDPIIMKLPAAITTVEEAAFEGGAVEAMIIPAGCAKLEAMAFADCDSLIMLRFEGSETEIADDAIPTDSILWMEGPEGSTAQEYAQANGILFLVR